MLDLQTSVSLQGQLLANHKEHHEHMAHAIGKLFNLLITDKLLAWATASFNLVLMKHLYAIFKQEFQEVFNQPKIGKDTQKRLLNINQGEESAADFALIFPTMAAESQWNEPAF